jgi:hypothetical protein
MTVYILIALSIPLALGLFYQQRKHWKQNKALCSSEHLSELVGALNSLKSRSGTKNDDGPESENTEEGKDDSGEAGLTHEITSQNLVVTYSSSLYSGVGASQEQYWLHHLSMAHMDTQGKLTRLTAKNAAYLCSYAIHAFQVEGWNERIQISKRGVVHLDFHMQPDEHEAFMEKGVEEVLSEEKLETIDKLHMSIRIQKLSSAG